MQHKKPLLWFPFALTIIFASLSIFVLTQSPGKVQYYDYDRSNTRTTPDRREVTCRSLLDSSSEDLHCISIQQRHLAWLMFLGPATVGSIAYTGWAYRRFLQAEFEEDKQLAKSQEESSGGQESSTT